MLFDLCWVICFRWVFIFIDEFFDDFDLVGVVVICELFDVDVCGCWVWVFCGVLIFCDCIWLVWIVDGVILLVVGVCVFMFVLLVFVVW